MQSWKKTLLQWKIQSRLKFFLDIIAYTINSLHLWHKLNVYLFLYLSNFIHIFLNLEMSDYKHLKLNSNESKVLGFISLTIL